MADGTLKVFSTNYDMSIKMIAQKTKSFNLEDIFFPYESIDNKKKLNVQLIRLHGSCEYFNAIDTNRNSKVAKVSEQQLSDDDFDWTKLCVKIGNNFSILNQNPYNQAYQMLSNDLKISKIIVSQWAIALETKE